MAISASLLTQNGSNADAQAYTSLDVVTLTANNLYLCCASSANSTATPTPSIQFGAVVWSLVTSVTWLNTASPDVRSCVFYTMVSSDTSSVLTVNYSTTMEAGQFIAVQMTGTDTSGTSGSGAIVQSAINRADTGTTSPATNALNAFSNAANVAFAYGGINSSDAINPESGFTILGSQSNTVIAGTMHTTSEWHTGEDTTPTFTTASNRNWGVVSVEIAVAGAAGASPIATDLIEGMLLQGLTR